MGVRAKSPFQAIAAGRAPMMVGGMLAVLAGGGPSVAATYETIATRLGVCANFVIFRDPSRIDDVAPEMLGEQEDYGNPDGDIEESFGRNFVTLTPEGRLNRTVGFAAHRDAFRPRSEVSCGIGFWEVSPDDALRAANLVVGGFATQFRTIQPMEQVGRSNRIGFCTSEGRPILVTLNYDDAGDVAGLEMRDILPGETPSGVTGCDPEAASE
ncbi:hypothetical protein [Gymnodinialimonas sp.]